MRRDLTDIQYELERIAARLGQVAASPKVPPFEQWVRDCVFQHMGRATTQEHDTAAHKITLWIEQNGFSGDLWAFVKTFGFTGESVHNLIMMIRGQIGICSYCRNLYHMSSGTKVHQLSEDEYKSIESENGNTDSLFSCGVCSTCHQEVMRR